MKKAGFFILFLALVLTVSGCRLVRREEKLPEDEETPRPVVEKSALKFSEENPYVYLVPRTDGHALNLYVSRFGEAKHLEYELTYKAGTQLQGAIGRFDLEGEQIGPREILLGTCSKGVCKYDESVSEGTLILKFLYQDIREEKDWRSDFHLQNIGVEGKKISSKDGKFTLDIPRGAMSRSVFVLTMPLLSLPETLGQEIVGDPYSVLTSTPSLLTKKATASFLFFTLPDNFEALSIFGWSDEGWVEYKTTANNLKKELTAEVDRFTSFVVAKKF
jgi:hypothetical protein